MFPPFDGFWSKDKIIEVALTQNIWLGLCALAGAGVTGFYMTRLMLMTFFGKDRWEKDVHPHESPKVMTIPLMVLGALSLVGGLLLLNDWIVDFLSPVTGVAPHEEPPLPAEVISLIALVVVAVGVGDRLDDLRPPRGSAHGAGQGLGVHHRRAQRALR